jgi:hypothetical protein
MEQVAPREGSQMNAGFATRGNGTAIHITSECNGSVVALCDKWASAALCSTRRKGSVCPIQAEAATCKSCLKISASKEMSA